MQASLGLLKTNAVVVKGEEAEAEAEVEVEAEVEAEAEAEVMALTKVVVVAVTEAEVIEPTTPPEVIERTTPPEVIEPTTPPDIEVRAGTKVVVVVAVTELMIRRVPMDSLLILAVVTVEGGEGAGAEDEDADEVCKEDEGALRALKAQSRNSSVMVYNAERVRW